MTTASPSKGAPKDARGRPAAEHGPGDASENRAAAGGRRGKPASRKPTRKATRKSDRRTSARIAAVQALYQLSATNAAPEAVLDEFRRHRMSEAGPASTADKALFTEVFRGACSDREALNALIAGAIAEDWALERMDRVLVALLNAGAWELLGRPETPARVVIAEYVDVARVFFDKREPAFVNGLLDKLARQLRQQEFAAPDAADKPVDGATALDGQ